MWELGGIASVLTALAGVLATAGGGIAWLVRRHDKARSAIPRASAEVAHASEAVGGALSVVQASLERDLARVRQDADEDRARFNGELITARERIAALEDSDRIKDLELRAGRERIAHLERDRLADREVIGELSAAVELLRSTEGRLVGWVALLHAGVEAGNIPPLPALPEWLIGLLARLDAGDVNDPPEEAPGD